MRLIMYALAPLLGAVILLPVLRSSEGAFTYVALVVISYGVIAWLSRRRTRGRN